MIETNLSGEMKLHRGPPELLRVVVETGGFETQSHTVASVPVMDSIVESELFDNHAFNPVLTDLFPPVIIGGGNVCPDYRGVGPQRGTQTAVVKPEVADSGSCARSTLDNSSPLTWGAAINDSTGAVLQL